MPEHKKSLRFAVLTAVFFGAFPLASWAAPPPRVIVLGFDGADHALVEKGIAEGRLPNLAALAAKGGFSALNPTIPAQTPVSWSTFSTGLSPGRTMIFDFLKRNPKTYRPEFAIAEEGKKNFLFGKGNRVAIPAILALVAFALVLLLSKIFLRRRGGAIGLGIACAAAAAAGFLGVRVSALLPSEIPWPINNRRGTPFWEEAGRKGIASVVMHVPVTFPAVDYDHGRLLSGLGVTDVRGRVGTPSFYTSDPFFAPKNKNEFSVELVRLESNKGTIETEVFGPYNKLFKEPAVIKTPMTLTLAADGGSLTVAPKGSHSVTLKPGEWSPWVVFTFPFNSLVKMTGIGRFHLMSTSPEIKLYLSPIHFNPSDLPPSVKITAPGGLAKKLADRYGLYKTMGWQIDTWSMSEETIDEKAFLEDVDQTIEPFRKMMNDFLDDQEVRLFVQIYEFPDRVAHCFWRFLDPQHPAYDAAKAAKWAPAVDRTYAQMDAIVGDAMKKLGRHPHRAVRPRFRDVAAVRELQHVARRERVHDALGQRGQAGRPRDAVRAGRVLAERGLVEDEGVRDGPRRHLHQPQGARGQGSVSPGAEYEAVREEIKRKLVTLVDPKTGQRAVSRIFTREEAYGSFDADVIPDLFVTNTAGYRIGWQGSLGVVTKEMFEDNEQIWSGDHCSLDPALVPGILFANRPLPKDKLPGIADVPATIYNVLGVPPPEKLDGVPLF